MEVTADWSDEQNRIPSSGGGVNAPGGVAPVGVGPQVTASGLGPPVAPIEAYSVTQHQSNDADSPLFRASLPLGGAQPVELPEKRDSRRHLVLALLLFILAVAAGKASTMPWRDYMWQNNAMTIETGWTRNDGVLGFGWVTMVFAMCLAGSGLLIATARERIGRVIAVTAGISLMLLATMEWGVNGANSRNGPGSGLWVQLLAGAAAVLVVGMISPTENRP